MSVAEDRVDYFAGSRPALLLTADCPCCPDSPLNALNLGRSCGSQTAATVGCLECGREFLVNVFLRPVGQRVGKDRRVVRDRRHEGMGV